MFDNIIKFFNRALDKTESDGINHEDVFNYPNEIQCSNQDSISLMMALSSPEYRRSMEETRRECRNEERIRMSLSKSAAYGTAEELDRAVDEYIKARGKNDE
jgi:hypothetical protein